MTPSIAYTASERTARMGASQIIIRSLTPQMTDEKRRETKEKIQGELYGIFRKYMT